MADPDIIFGGSQKQRFDKNKRALELLEKLNAEGCQATAEEQVVLASYTGWGLFVPRPIPRYMEHASF